jgi:RNA polymerase sigma factor (sigma-70 family)
LDRLTDIVQAAKDGDRQAFGTIVLRFQDMAYGRAYAWLGDHGQAQDAAQEAFIDAYLHLNQLREPAAFPGWFGRIVVKHSDRLSRSAKPSIGLDDAPPLISNAPDPLQVTVTHETERLIQERLATLSCEQREAVELFHLDGFSQREVAEFLDVPVSTVKKRLYDARKNLKKGLRKMAPTKTPEKRPSQDDGFQRRVQFFIAIRTRDFNTLSKLIEQDARLFDAKTDPDVAPELWWSRDITAVFWAVQTGDHELLKFLLDRGAGTEGIARSSDTPLHHAVMMGDHKLVELLIDKGANLGAVAGHEQTALHRASLAGDSRLVEMLVDGGAKLEVQDAEGRTAADWAALKSRRAVLDFLLERGAQAPTAVFAEEGSYLILETEQKGLLGRIIDAGGNPIDERGPIVDPSILPAKDTGRERPIVLETGIKPLDLFAPMRRGSTIGQELCLHVGAMLLHGQIAHNLVTRDNARVVFILAPEGSLYLGSSEFWYGTGNSFRNGVTMVAVNPNDPEERLRATVRKGFEVANALRSAGYDVLVQLQGRLYPYADLAELNRGTDDHGSITTKIQGNPPNGLVDIDEAFDSEIHMSPHLASQGLYPAIDWEYSRSSLLEDGTLSQSHVDTVREVQRRGYEYTHFNLGAARKKHGESFMYMSDGGVTVQRMRRTRRLGLFLTQSYHGTEMWTGKPGVTVPLSHTVETCRDILDGKYDEVPERAFYAMGRMEGVLERSRIEDVKKED